MLFLSVMALLRAMRLITASLALTSYSSSILGSWKLSYAIPGVLNISR